MEEKKINHKGRKIATIVCIIIANILLITLICLYCYQVIQKKDAAIEQRILEIEKQKTEQLLQSAKKDETTQKSSDSIVYSKVQSRKSIGKDTHGQKVDLYVDVDIPCINKTDQAATAINHNIMEAYQKEINFVQGKSTDTTPFTNSVVKVSYTYEEKDDILYLLTQKEVNVVSSEGKTYYKMYIYDKKNEKELTSKDILYQYGIEQASIIKALQGANPDLGNIDVGEKEIKEALSQLDTFYITPNDMGQFMISVEVDGIVDTWIDAMIK